MASVWEDLRGTVLNIFGIGIGNPQIKASGTELQVRDSTDADYADMHVQEIILQKAGSAFKMTVGSPTLGSDATVTLPLTGTIPNQTGLHYTKITSFNQASGATFTLDSAPPVSGTLIEVRTIVDVAASASNPTLSIGVSGTPARDQATTENNLRSAAQFVTEPWLAMGGSPAAIIATLSAASQTFSGRIALTYVLA